jgi:hypothetical protein
VALSRVSSPAPVLTLAQDDRARTLRFARTCYGHLAGQVGVAVTHALCAKEFLYQDEVGYHVTPSGIAWFGARGIELSALKSRPLTRPCLDWSERRHLLNVAFIEFCNGIIAEEPQGTSQTSDGNRDLL